VSDIETSASTPITPSTSAYQSSGERQRCEKRATSHEPIASPLMKMISTSDCAYAAWPRNSLR
jgi:hypothetical protein